MSRYSESKRAVETMRAILAAKPKVPGVTQKRLRDDISLAISLLEARMYDAETQE